MSQENVEIIYRGYEMFAAGDFEGAAALFSPDAEVATAGGLGVVDSAVGMALGPEGFLRANEDVRESFDDYRVEPNDFIDAGDAVVVPARISGRGRGSEVELDTEVVHLWALREGKVVLGEVYRTVDEALEAAKGYG